MYGDKSTRRLTAGASLALLLALMAACGSTVQVPGAVSGEQSLAGPGGGLAPVGPGPGNPSSLPLTPGGSAPAGGTPGSVGLPTTVGGVPIATSGPAPTSGNVPDVVQGRGVTATSITIGAAIPTGTEEVGEALGISGAGAVPEEAMWNAVVNDVNKTGGVLGRKLVLYNHSIDFAAYVANPEQTFAELCADFRDDHKVFAAMVYVANPSLRHCLAKMGSPLYVYGAFTMVPEGAYAEHGGSYLYGTNSISNERLAALMVQSLMARNFTQTWDTTNGGPGVQPLKLAVIHADTPDQNNLYAAYARELARYGLKFDETVTYSGDASDALAATQSAVLRFSSSGVTHVFGASAFFLRYAESQHYRPRYAYLPGLGTLGAQNSPPEQLRGAQTVGWSPAQDVAAGEDPGDLAGSAHCREVMKKAGLPAGNRTDVKLMYAVCDAVYSFRAALTAGREPSVAGLRAGFESLGTRFAPALTFNALLGPGRHYGVSSVRDMEYDSGCSCLKYTSRSNRS